MLPRFLHLLKNYILVAMCKAFGAKLKICFKISVGKHAAAIVLPSKKAASFFELAIAV